MLNNIFVQGQRLDVADTFVCLQSTLTGDGSLGLKIKRRIKKTIKAFGKLEKRV